MTAPLPPSPEISIDPLLDTLPGSVVASQESSTIMRIGVVAAIIEGSQITVKISGSEVLIDCSYLFGQYFPLMGDRVVVFKQDSQWFCIGQMSGAIDSNNPLFNSSFEDGTIPNTPTGWSISVISSGAGVPTFETAAPGATIVSGKQVADFGTDSIGAGTSEAHAFSSTLSAPPDSKWTGAFWLTGALLGSVAPDFSDLEFYIQFLDVTGTLIIEHNINDISVGVDVLSLLYRRLNLTNFPDGFVAAPANSVFVRVKFRAVFRLPAVSFASFFIDNVILRQVD